MTSISGEGGDGEDGGMAGGFVFMVKSCRLVPCKKAAAALATRISADNNIPDDLLMVQILSDGSAGSLQAVFSLVGLLRFLHPARKR